MLLRDYGFDAQVAELARTAGVAESDLGRVTADHGIRCIVATDQGEEAAALAGTLRGADRKNERPAVGDWVVLRRESSAAGSLSTIESILPRRSRIARKVAGRQTTDQIVAANVDLALVVVAFGRDVNVSRIERFVAICRDGSVEPLVVITKADLADSAEAERSELASAVPGVTVVAVSALRGDGLESLRSRLQGTVTAVLLGTSGAGKSTLLNALSGSTQQATQAVREDGKGRHTTTARTMFRLPSGAMIIDTPGIRELGLATEEGGVDQAFDEIASYAANCRFSDCTHANEPGCGVRDAVKAGAIDRARLEAWQALRAEERSRQAESLERRRTTERVRSRALRRKYRDDGRD